MEVIDILKQVHEGTISIEDGEKLLMQQAQKSNYLQTVINCLNIQLEYDKICDAMKVFDYQTLWEWKGGITSKNISENLRDAVFYAIKILKTVCDSEPDPDKWKCSTQLGIFHVDAFVPYGEDYAEIAVGLVLDSFDTTFPLEELDNICNQIKQAQDELQ